MVQAGGWKSTATLCSPGLELGGNDCLPPDGIWSQHEIGSHFSECYGGYYTQEEMRQLIAYGASQGIMLVPEIDMPGHAYASLVAYPWLALEAPPAASLAAMYSISPIPGYDSLPVMCWMNSWRSSRPAHRWTEHIRTPEPLFRMVFPRARVLAEKFTARQQEQMPG